MKTLIVEDDMTSRLLLRKLLEAYGPSETAENGVEAVLAVKKALDADEQFDLICLDIMMPEMDGHQALRMIRREEEIRGIYSSDGAKIVMTTALDNLKNVSKAFGDLCDGYLVKPIDRPTLVRELEKLKLIKV